MQGLLAQSVPASGEPLIQGQVLLLDYCMDLLQLCVVMMVLFLHFEHVLLELLHDLHLHLDFDVALPFPHLLPPLRFVVVALLLVVDEVVAPDLLLGLLRHPLNLKFLLLADPHHPADGLAHIFVLLLAALFEHGQDLGSGEDELDLFHEEDADGVLVLVDVLDEFDVEGYHAVEEFFGEVVGVEEFLQFQQFEDLFLLHVDLHQIGHHLRQIIYTLFIQSNDSTLRRYEDSSDVQDHGFTLTSSGAVQLRTPPRSPHPPRSRSAGCRGSPPRRRGCGRDGSRCSAHACRRRRCWPAR